MEVLFEYQGHRSVVKCKHSRLLEYLERDLSQFVGLSPQTALMKPSMQDRASVYTLQSMRKGGGGKRPARTTYLLQRHVKDWETFVNVDNIDQVKNRDRLTVVQTNTSSPSSSHNPSAHSPRASTATTKFAAAATKVSYIAYILAIAQ